MAVFAVEPTLPAAPVTRVLSWDIISFFFLVFRFVFNSRFCRPDDWTIRANARLLDDGVIDTNVYMPAERLEEQSPHSSLHTSVYVDAGPGL
jgi:hypothetical protein